jgi:2-polyprenyl-6-methoxyphenol hydroxylase-like FAD-dependent oxidoreductase
MKTYDAIVVGTRCAGSTVATFLSRAGYQVLMVDRTFFPSDVISTHTIFNNTVDTLKDLGVLDKLLETDTPEVLGMRAQFDDVVLEGAMPEYNGERRSFCFRRTHFDKIMLDHARSQENVTAIEGLRVSEVIKEDGVVVGIRGRDREGNTVEYRGKIVIGADGRNSTIRREVGAANKVSVATEYATFYGYFENVLSFTEPKFELYQIGKHRAYIFPTSDGAHVIAACFPHQDTYWMERFKTEGEQAVRDYFTTILPDTKVRLEPARLAEPVKGIIDFNNHWFEGMGAGWALVGDAICFKDPGMGQGMHDAIFGGRILANILKDNADWNTVWSEMAEQYQTTAEDEFMARFHAACYLTTVASDENVAADVEFHREVGLYPETITKFFGFYNYASEREELIEALETAKATDLQKAVS